jgi:hypothetical protein
MTKFESLMEKSSKKTDFARIQVSKNFEKLAVKCKMRADDTKLTQKSRLRQNFTMEGKKLELFVTTLTFKTPKILT